MTCPRCSSESLEGAIDCASCGLIFAKYRPPVTRSRAEVAADMAAAGYRPIRAALNERKAPEPEWLGITHAGWRAAAIGLGLASILSFFPFLSFILSPIVTLVHELGHTTAYWTFGYPAIPAFDFGEGGGVTLGQEREPFIVYAYATGLAGLCWHQREHLMRVIGLVCLGLVYFAMYGGRGEDILMSLGGHGGEVVFGGLFLYRALTGWGCKIEVERPLYALLGFVVLFASMRLGVSLLTFTTEKHFYLQGKRGIDNDLVTGGQLLGWTLESTARGLVLATVLAIAAAIGAAMMRRSIGALSEEEEAALETATEA
jgi:hypothetical protein